MQKPIKYAIFQTKWGYFGLAGTESTLCRTHLPGPNPENIKTMLLKNLPPPNLNSRINYPCHSVRNTVRHPAEDSLGERSEESQTYLARSSTAGFLHTQPVTRNSHHKHQASPQDTLWWSIEFDKTFFETLQKQIAAYFDGTRIDFSPKIPLDLDRLSPFHRSVLTACREIRFGQTITYAELAARAGRPAAARAVGSALAKNPLPLLVPCHRVLRSDGQIGGFSAPGAITVKKRLLLHEQRCR